jgi:tetratricopeptide (TPR) repeat protein
LAQGATSTQSAAPPSPTSGKETGAKEPKKPGTESPPTNPLESATAEIEALQKEAKGIATSLVESFPSNPGGLRVLGLVYNACGEKAKALQWWEKALRLAPSRSDLYVLVATQAELQGQHEKVAVLCRTGLVKSVPTPVLYRSLATALISLGKPDEAVAPLQRAVEIAPNDDENHQLLGKAYSMLNQHEKAKTSYELAVKLQPRNVSAHYGLAMACAKLGLEEQSQRSLEQCRKLAAENMSVQQRMRGVSHAVERERQNLAATCAEAAMVYNGQRRFEKAEELLRRAAVCAPTKTTFRIWLASLLVNTDRAQEAIPIYREVIAIEPKNPVHYLALAEIYARLRRFDDARVAAREAVDLAPDNENYRRILQQLQARR